MRSVLLFLTVLLNLSPARAADASSLLRSLLDKPLPASTSPASAAGKFKSSGTRLALAAFLASLSDKPDEQKVYSEALLGVVVPLEAELRKLGRHDDVAAALTLYLVETYQRVTAQVVAEAASDALLRQLDALFAVAEFRTLSDADKQRSYETFLYSYALDSLLLEIAGPDQQQAVRDSAAQKLEALLGLKVSEMRFSGQGLSLVTSSSGSTAPSLSFSVPPQWSVLDDLEGTRRYSWTFSEADGYTSTADGRTTPIRIPNTLEVSVLPELPREGTLEAQTRALWTRLTGGQLDAEGITPPVFVARTPAGMNAGYVRGTRGSMENPQGSAGGGTLYFYSLLYLLEHGQSVTPLLFVAREANSGYGPAVQFGAARTAVLNFLLSARSSMPLNPAPLFDPQDLLGKWAKSSSFFTTYSTLYGGSYAGSSSTFVFRYTFKPGGEMQYYAQAAQLGVGGGSVRTYDEPARWTLSGDLLTISVPAQGWVNRYKLYAVARDAENRPTLVLTFLTGNNAQGVSLDSLPEDAWTVAQD